MSKVRTNIRVAAIADLAVRIVKAFFADALAMSDTVLSEIVKSIEQMAATLVTAINKNLVVSELDTNDRSRDTATRGVFYLVAAYLCIEKYAAAAEKINAVLNRYGLKTLQEAYAEESTHIESMLEDLSAAELAEAIAALPVLQEAIAALRERQTAFNEVRVKYQSMLAQQSSGENAVDIRKQIVQTINSRLLPYLSVMSETDSAKYGAFAATVNKMISEANALIDQRASSAAAKETPTDDAQGDTPVQ